MGNLNRMSARELHTLFNRVADITYRKDSMEPEKGTARASMTQIKRVLISRRP